MFDSKDKQWQRFQDLAYHYFRFKIRTEKKRSTRIIDNAMQVVKIPKEETLQRKDRMPDKVLFHFNEDRTFLHLDMPAKPSKTTNNLLILRHRLTEYYNTHFEQNVREACKIILDNLDRGEIARLVPTVSLTEIKALQTTIALKMDGDQRSAVEILEEVHRLLANSELF